MVRAELFNSLMIFIISFLDRVLDLKNPEYLPSEQVLILHHVSSTFYSLPCLFHLLFSSMYLPSFILFLIPSTFILFHLLFSSIFYSPPPFVLFLVSSTFYFRSGLFHLSRTSWLCALIHLTSLAPFVRCRRYLWLIEDIYGWSIQLRSQTKAIWSFDPSEQKDQNPTDQNPTV